MPYQLPTLKDLLQKSRLQFRANLKGTDAWLWPNNVYASAKVVGGMVFEVFGFAAYIAKQIFAHTAPDIETLRMHGEEFGMPQKPRAPASGPVTLTSTGDLIVPAGAVFTRADGIQYIAAAGGSRSGAGTLTITVISATDGKINNADAGTSLAVDAAIAGSPTAVVGTGGIVAGADDEDIELYRARILFRKRNPPMGGSASDYVLWATNVSGVTRVFVERLWSGPGTVRVFVLMDDLYPTTSGIPSPANVQRVADYIDTVRPSGAVVTVVAPTAHVINVQIAGITPNTPAVQEAVVAELIETFERLSRVCGSDTPHGGMPYIATTESFSRSWIWQAIANATGEQRHILNLPAADVSLGLGEMATLGTVTFV